MSLAVGNVDSPNFISWILGKSRDIFHVDITVQIRHSFILFYNGLIAFDVYISHQHIFYDIWRDNFS